MRKNLTHDNSAYDEQGDADARVQHVNQEVLIVHEVDEDVVCEQPLGGPRIENYEREAAGNKLRLASHNRGLVDDPVDPERVLTAETGLELLVGNVSALARGAGMLARLSCAAFGSLLPVLFMGRLGFFPRRLVPLLAP